MLIGSNEGPDTVLGRIYEQPRSAGGGELGAVALARPPPAGLLPPAGSAPACLLGPGCSFKYILAQSLSILTYPSSQNLLDIFFSYLRHAQ